MPHGARRASSCFAAMDGAVRIAAPDRYEWFDERSARKRLTMDVTQGGRADAR